MMMVLLSIRNTIVMFKLMGKKIITIIHSKIFLISYLDPKRVKIVSKFHAQIQKVLSVGVQL